MKQKKKLPTGSAAPYKKKQKYNQFIIFGHR
jgi:hypothetical protein